MAPKSTETETETETETPVLDIQQLEISSVNRKGEKLEPIVHGISLSVKSGTMTGLVGESGSGKTLTTLAILGLLPSSLKVTGGTIKLNGEEISSMPERKLRALRGKKISYLFQNYQGSFSPFRSIGKQLVEALRFSLGIGPTEAKAVVFTWLERVRLPAERVFSSCCFQLSGGQLQRVALAAALMVKPSLIIADEPTTALDVLSGEQVLDLLSELQRETGCAVLFISHDLAHVLKRTDRVAVMYKGRIVEMGPTSALPSAAGHPYTQRLLQARPSLRGTIPERLSVLEADVRALPGGSLSLQNGCSFVPYCSCRTQHCEHTPELRNEGAHAVACHEWPVKEAKPNAERTAASAGEAAREVVYS
nr:ABC transporter ATP-binding protein [Paenibacillus turpanensis]